MKKPPFLSQSTAHPPIQKKSVAPVKSKTINRMDTPSCQTDQSNIIRVQ